MSDESTSVAARFPAPELAGLDDAQRVTLCEALDRILNKGAVVVGEVTISVAGVDLVYLGLQLLLTSVETGRASARRPFGAVGVGLGVADKDRYGAN